MSEEVFVRVEDHFRPGLFVTLTGWGEPLLDARLEHRIVRAREKGCTVYISTNAVFLTARRAQALLETGLDGISFSLDAASPEVYRRIRDYDFRVVRKNIETFLDLRQKGGFRTLVDLSFVVMRDNIGEIGPFLKLAQRWGVDFVAFSPRFLLFSDRDYRETYVPVATIEKEIARHYQSSYSFKLRLFGLGEYPQKDCFACATTTPFVSAQGEISPCCILGHRLPRYIPSTGERAIFYQGLGNLRQRSLKEIWDQEEYRHFRLLLSRGEVPSCCRGCHLLPRRKGFLG